MFAKLARSTFSQTCRTTRESVAKRPPGKTRDWAPPAKQHTRTATLVGVGGPPTVTSRIAKIRFNGRTTRPVGRRQKNEGASEALAVAEVEAVENRDKNNRRAAADSATYIASAHRLTATVKEATRSRLGELHRSLKTEKAAQAPPTGRIQ